ncbi:hypothetical protein B7W85_26900 [Allorhizobium ampelinum]|nr:hypothetical protein [Agrobacterium vitis]OHZ34593.1 hypothetical protein BBL07_19445 [Agrobacterium vitis]OVE86507.1 hypothetical protein B7W85_26900 [Allorhizobium ampelinum]
MFLSLAFEKPIKGVCNVLGEKEKSVQLDVSFTCGLTACDGGAASGQGPVPLKTASRKAPGIFRFL